VMGDSDAEEGRMIALRFLRLSGNGGTIPGGDRVGVENGAWRKLLCGSGRLRMCEIIYSTLIELT
jgi:hypothetical protein